MKTSTLVIALSLVVACSRREPPAADAPTPPSVASTTAAPFTKGESLYQLEMKLTDQDGKPTSLDVFRGHPTLVTMFYATCPAACPRLVHDITVMEKRLDPAVRADLRVLLVSFDTRRDDPAALAKAAERHGVDLTRWKLAVASSDDSARELAAVLGFQYRKQENGEYSHSSRLSVVDGSGVIIAQADGFAEALEELVPTLQRLK